MDSAPTPLKAADHFSETATAIDTATASVLMVALSKASNFRLPVFASTLVSAFWIYALTSLPTSFRAKLTPMEAAIATSLVPRNVAATDTAPALAVMVEVSLAVRAIALAEIPSAPVPSPSINALTIWAILLSANTPAPLAAILTGPLPLTDTANEPAPTSAVIV